MSKVTINHQDQLNELEVIVVADYMEKNYPDVHYTMTPGNDCIWVYYGNINKYFIFRGGKLVDIQID
jgi:hypothetical protein